MASVASNGIETLGSELGGSTHLVGSGTRRCAPDTSETTPARRTRRADDDVGGMNPPVHPPPAVERGKGRQHLPGACQGDDGSGWGSSAQRVHTCEPRHQGGALGATVDALLKCHERYDSGVGECGEDGSLAPQGCHRHAAHPRFHHQRGVVATGERDGEPPRAFHPFTLGTATAADAALTLSVVAR